MDELVGLKDVVELLPDPGAAVLLLNIVGVLMSEQLEDW